MEPDRTNVLAVDDLQLVVIIDQAYYADYDEDGIEDDVVTSFRVLVADDDNFVIGGDSSVNYMLNIQTELVLPSGALSTYDFQVSTTNGVGITLGWVNHATEAGWYDFTVNAECVNVVIDSGKDSVTFDPPSQPGDDPFVEIVLKQL
jgi:hypothetical protein